MSSSWVRTYRGDRHLSSALDNSLIRLLIQNRENPNLPVGYQEFFAEYIPKDAQFAHNDNKIGVYCIYKMVKRISLESNVRKNELPRDMRIMCLLATMAVGHHTQETVNIQHLLRDLRSNFQHHDINLYHSMRDHVEIIRRHISKSTKKKMIVKIGHTSLVFFEEIFTFFCPQCTRHHIEPYSVFLAVHDMIVSRLSTLVFALLKDTIDQPSQKSLVETVQMFHHLDTALDTYGNDAYTLFKALPSLAVGSVLGRYDPVDQGLFLRSIIAQLTTDGFEMSFSSNSYFYRTPADLEDARLLLEMSGLWKVSGHPIIDHHLGVAKVREKGGYPKIGLVDIGKRIRNAFRLIFCREYFRVSGKWVECDVSQCPEVIQQSKNRGIWSESPSLPWPSSHFHLIQFKKTFDFDFHPDLSELVSDTSVIPGLSQWHYELGPNWIHRLVYGSDQAHRQYPRRTNKVILNYLTELKLDLQQIINVIERDQVPEEWKVIVLIAKEKELKIAARYFAKCVPEIRFWQCGTEKMIGEYILKYLRYQSMTMSDDKLQARLLTMSGKLRQHKEITTVSVIVDFSSWNLQFRHETVSGLLQDLDNLFGLSRTFSYTHLFPMESFILVRDNGSPVRESTTGLPNIGPRCFIGQESFFEGMRQKGWTLYTISLILSVAVDLKAHIDLLGQGDNQAILIQIPKPYRTNITQVIQYVDQFCTHLHEVCTEAQIPIRLDETWRSSILFEYSRVTFLDGVQGSSSRKKAAKIAVESNNPISSWAADLAAIGSSGVSIASVDSHPLPAYMLTVFEILQYLHDTAPDLYQKDDDFFLVFLSLTRVMGGLPLSSYMSFCIRGCPDPLTENISLITYLWNTYPPCRRWIRSLVQLKRTRYANLELLIEDPACLSLDLPMRVENYLKNTFRRTVADITTHPVVASLFEINSTTERSHLIDDLSRIIPRNPRVLNYLYNSSNVALQERMIGRFSSPLTIIRVTAAEITNYTDLWSIINMYDELMKKFYDRLPNDNEITLNEIYLQISPQCSFDVAEHLREIHWGPLYGITMPSPTEQLITVSWEDYRNQHGDGIRTRILNTLKTALTSRGPAFPYLGSDTKEKIKRPPLSFTGSTSLIRAAIRLTSLIPWLGRGEDPGVRGLMNSIIQEKNVISNRALEEISGYVSGGTIYHRLNDCATDHGARVNSTHTFSSNLSITSDTFLLAARSTQDRTIFFQQIKAYIVSWFRHQVLFSKISPGDYISMINCYNCTREINEPDMVLPGGVSYRGVILPLHISNVTVTSSLREITLKHPENSQHLLSLALACLSSKFIVNFDRSIITDQVSTIQTIDEQSLCLTDLSSCDAKLYFFYLLSYLGDLSLQDYPLSVTESISPLITKQRGKFVNLVQLLFASGLLERIFREFDTRCAHSNWSTPDNLRTQSFYILLIHSLKRIDLSTVLPRPPLSTAIDSEAHTDFLKKITGTDPIITPDPDTIIALHRLPARSLLSSFKPHHSSSHHFLLPHNPLTSNLHSIPHSTLLPRVITKDLSLHNMGRMIGTEATSITKMIEILQVCSIPDEGIIVCLAEGDGSIASYLLHLFPDEKLVFNTLQDELDVRPHSTLEVPRSLYADPCQDWRPNLLEWPKMFSGTTDLSNRQIIQKLKSICSFPIRLLTCDVNELPNYQTVLINVAEIIMELKPEMAILKVMVYSHCVEHLLRNMGYSYKLIVPRTSNFHTGEAYLILERSSGILQICTYQNLVAHYNSLVGQYIHDVKTADSISFDIGISLCNQYKKMECKFWIKYFYQTLGCNNLKTLPSVLLKSAIVEHAIWISGLSWEDMRKVKASLSGRFKYSSTERTMSFDSITDHISKYLVWIEILSRVPLNLRDILLDMELEHQSTLRWHLDINHDRPIPRLSLCCNEFCLTKGSIREYEYTPKEIIDKTIRQITKLYTYQMFLLSSKPTYHHKKFRSSSNLSLNESFNLLFR